jgi:hypothetical protein
MMYVALAAIAAWAASVLALAGVLRSAYRQHARDREMMLARIMHLAGRTWELPPAQEKLELEDEPKDYSWGEDAPVAS